MESCKCPNCGAELVMLSDKMICNYCDSEFAYKKKPNQSKPANKTNKNKVISNNVYAAVRLFDDAGLRNLSDYGMETWNNICKYINGENGAGYVDEAFTDNLFIRIAGTDARMAMKNVNSQLFQSVLNKVSSQLKGGEVPIFYKDSGIFSKGKEGMLITNTGVLFFKKNKFKKINYRDIHTIIFDGLQLSWLLNSKEFEVTRWNCTPIQHGVIIAFICQKARGCNPVGYKIKVKKINC